MLCNRQSWSLGLFLTETELSHRSEVVDLPQAAGQTTEPDFHLLVLDALPEAHEALPSKHSGISLQAFRDLFSRIGLPTTTRSDQPCAGLHFLRCYPVYQEYPF